MPFPVKNGWQAEQTSISKLSLADPTIIVFPQAHFIFAFGKYFGCIPAFILDYNSKNYLKRKGGGGVASMSI
ncbi:hypothetical protein A3F23_01305 [Candidatus Giovannonibacteria bacterium RIFCSPHIGHO2_12_FULL_43_15]|uniref:Uncharacterized protein n=1 Tax=Candidatus Giovannonibacteria bacterium RIFCSPHIGHO2_12_FULL_43_15 TaxID=1798341 RepID=A0A1F5WRR2_9BACT|nr:MAG: hypothetical protein A3F23_01305 [Candidatus Giovannonibacteria bacterium RIFCSPHIGHO2_12_FULL_43_15]